MDGGTGHAWLIARLTNGLSPRGRGNRAMGCGRGPDVRSIPAWTGEPRGGYGFGRWPGVYPRVDGGTLTSNVTANSIKGLSPRGRGNRFVSQPNSDRMRSIPAWTGEPRLSLPFPKANGVYPRVDGGTDLSDTPEWLATGLSPRGRGNRGGDASDPDGDGSIPAWTGEPSGSNLPSLLSRVYPRVDGGTVWIKSAVAVVQGLSPRGRGNRGGPCPVVG